MANPVFGYPVFNDASVSFAPAYSGGSWQASLPLTNLSDRRLGRVARSTNALAASSTFDIDLGIARAVGVLAVLIPNLTKSSTPTIQWKGASDAGFTSLVYNPGAVQAWPTGVTAEDVTAPDGTTMNVWLTTVPATVQTARFWRLSIVDTANADGYLNVARVVIAGAYQPAEPMAVGANVGHETASVRTVTDGGAAVYLPKPRNRVDVFTIDKLAYAEAISTTRKMIRQLGTTSQFLWVPDPADTSNFWERTYLGVMKQLTPSQYVSGTRLGVQFSVVEEL